LEDVESPNVKIKNYMRVYSDDYLYWKKLVLKMLICLVVSKKCITFALWFEKDIMSEFYKVRTHYQKRRGLNKTWWVVFRQKKRSRVATLISRKSDRAYDEKWCGYHNKKSQTLKLSKLPLEVVELFQKAQSTSVQSSTWKRNHECL
jgi:hypothetical protein